MSHVDRKSSLNIPRKEKVENRCVSRSLCTETVCVEECTDITLSVSEYQQYIVAILEDLNSRKEREPFLMEMRQGCPSAQHKLQHASNSPGAEGLAAGCLVSENK
jgi:hypothetical protein